MQCFGSKQCYKLFGVSVALKALCEHLTTNVSQVQAV